VAILVSISLTVVWTCSRACAAAFLSFFAALPPLPSPFGWFLPRIRSAVELGRGTAIDQHQPVGGQLEHVAIVADQDHRALIFVERLDQRLARIDVQVVGRLVEDQHVRRVARDQRQREPRALAARELADLGRRLRARKAEAAELRAHRAGVLPFIIGSCARAACRPSSSST
jgi:hypothetical protein